MKSGYTYIMAGVGHRKRGLRVGGGFFGTLCSGETEIPFGVPALARQRLIFPVLLALAIIIAHFRPNGMVMGLPILLALVGYRYIESPCPCEKANVSLFPALTE